MCLFVGLCLCVFVFVFVFLFVLCVVCCLLCVVCCVLCVGVLVFWFWFLFLFLFFVWLVKIWMCVQWYHRRLSNMDSQVVLSIHVHLVFE